MNIRSIQPNVLQADRGEEIRGIAKQKNAEAGPGVGVEGNKIDRDKKTTDHSKTSRGTWVSLFRGPAPR